MGDSIELLKMQFIVRPDVDVCSLVLGRIAVFGGRENYSN